MEPKHFVSEVKKCSPISSNYRHSFSLLTNKLYLMLYVKLYFKLYTLIISRNLLLYRSVQMCLIVLLYYCQHPVIVIFFYSYSVSNLDRYHYKDIRTILIINNKIITSLTSQVLRYSLMLAPTSSPMPVAMTVPFLVVNCVLPDAYTMNNYVTK